ncbi:MAG TPA: GNAT family N-acetyltransferase [Gaiellaceae bacterium]|jgi:putative acetyltransferase|nr:GNAT family N-acetyltransferase [Gaiellaceae bacterium]
MSVETRPPRADEADELFRRFRETALVAYRHVFPPELYPFPDEAERSKWRRLVRDHGRTHRLVVAEVAGDVVGAVVATPGTLQHLFVVPSSWGTGVADALHAAAVEVSREAGVAECRLEVLAENCRARRFYERHGWVPDERSRPADYPPYPRVVGYRLPLRR